jgi:hypothetical protein
VEDDEAHKARKNYGRGLVEEEIDPCRVRVEPQSAEGEHFLEETRGGLE